MRIEKIEEPVEVIVHFGTGMVAPIRFLWRGRAHKVKSVRGRWTTLQGQQRCYHWAIMADDVGACELAMDGEQMSWRIDSVSIDD